MCGIVGYIGKEEAASILQGGLTRRNKDSLTPIRLEMSDGDGRNVRTVDSIDELEFSDMGWLTFCESGEIVVHEIQG